MLNVMSIFQQENVKFQLSNFVRIMPIYIDIGYYIGHEVDNFGNL